MPEDFTKRMHEVAKAVENVLVAGHAQRHWLKDDAPPFSINQGDLSPVENEQTSIAAALKHYGGMPCAAFDLWLMIRSVEGLRAVWTA